MIEPNHKRLSFSRQCELLGLNRSGIYYASKSKAKPDEWAIKKEMDKTYTSMPYYGVARMTAHLRKCGFSVNEKRVRRYFKELRITAIYPKPKAAEPCPEHKVYPYLLRNLKVDRPNQVWSTDVTYIPMNGGFMYLCAVIDWHSRMVLSWGLSNTHDSEFCQAVLKEAIARYGKPEIFNTDQGSEFTAKGFVSILLDNNIRVSMDGRGRALDNIFIERLWRSVKYEHIYLCSYSSGKELEQGLSRYLHQYNTIRLHGGLGYKTPIQVYQAA